jgi:hypothetical protein
MAPPSLTTQTLYAELVDRCSVAAFQAEFPLNGGFVRVKVKGRDYWYFQQGTRDASGKQLRKYVGPDSEDVRRRIEDHGRAKDDYRQRRQLVAMLGRAGHQGPPEATGSILQALSDAGVFRVRACLVGTTAYQVYAPMLGVRLPSASLQTQDRDIAQFTAISMAIDDGEQTPSLLEMLQRADPSFRPVPGIRKHAKTMAYINAAGFRVEALAESRGPDQQGPVALPAIGTHAQPLRFMDFLIRDEIRAAVLHDAGIPVNVPSPERYALHKLIIAQRRQANPAKIDKDIAQAEALLSVLAESKPVALRETWHEAFARGPKWQRLLADGLGMIAAKVRDRVLHVVGATRGIVPGLDLIFADAPARYDPDRDIIAFRAEDAGGERVLCAISREALDDHFGTDSHTNDERVAAFRHHRQKIEGMARQVYLHSPVPQDGAVLVRTIEVPDLLDQTAKQAKTKRRTTKSRRRPVQR